MDIMQRKTVIIAAKRSPIGAFQGQFSTLSASELASNIIKGIFNYFEVLPEQIDEVILGNVLSAGQGQAPARQSAIKGGCPTTVESLTINKMCGSGLKSVMLADQAIKCGDADIIFAGGMESMSNSPYLLNNARSGQKFGHGKILDSMIHDGLWDAYTNQHMGNCAELLAKERCYNRQDQDSFAIDSYKKAINATENDVFSSEIVPIKVKKKRGEEIIYSIDEEPGRVKFDKIPNLKPAFSNEGTITAANASKLNDGAAILLLTSEEKADELGLKPLAKIVGHCSAAHDPEWFTTAPGKAIKKLLDKTNLEKSNIDLWEINEAFSVVTMAAIDDFDIPTDKVNIYGGAIALGHPIGASGARIITTLLNAMNRTNSKLGLATLCIGGGEASAMIIEKND